MAKGCPPHLRAAGFFLEDRRHPGEHTRGTDQPRRRLPLPMAGRAELASPALS